MQILFCVKVRTVQNKISTKKLFGQALPTVLDDITGYGNTIKVHFVYSDPTGIENISSHSGAAKQIFSVSGARLNHMQHGLNIVKMRDGRTIKILK